jgi:hypothetical protein
MRSFVMCTVGRTVLSDKIKKSGKRGACSVHVKLRKAHVHRLCENLRGRRMCRWENNIKLKKGGCEGVGWIKLTKDNVM